MSHNDHDSADVVKKLSAHNAGGETKSSGYARHLSATPAGICEETTRYEEKAATRHKETMRHEEAAVTTCSRVVENDTSDATSNRPSHPSGEGTVRRQSVWRQGVEVFFHNRLAALGLMIVLTFVIFSFIGPLFYTTDQIHTDLLNSSKPPSAEHPLGTDGLGYDQLGRLMIGGQTSIIVGLLAGIFATFIGTLWGAIAGFVGGKVDSVMMRMVDAFMSIPTLFLFMLMATIITPSVPLLIIIIGAFAWLGPARLVRGETLSLRGREYILAMRGMGGTSSRAIRTHIVRNAIGTVVVNATFQVADAILYVAYLSFLGLGVPPPAANWGGMLSTGLSDAYSGNWWLIYPPGIAIILVVLAFNFIGDGLRDSFEVRLRKR